MEDSLTTTRRLSQARLSALRLAGAGCIALAVIATGCARSHSQVAVVNMFALKQDWPKFINYSRQLEANLAAIRASKATDAEKQRQFDQLQEQSRRWENEVVGEVQSAAKSIAADRHYALVVTRQGVAYGGDDITPDVEKALKITPASPSPSR